MSGLDALLKNPKIIDCQIMDAHEYGRMVHAIADTCVSIGLTTAPATAPRPLSEVEQPL
jgi:hypothetical protein